MQGQAKRDIPGDGEKAEIQKEEGCYVSWISCINLVRLGYLFAL